jgi:bifunctional UDP-N-acetylglucosamine pyrophosphorylase/glucosamine-1-phosphate N-acetyltransferase
MKSDLPKVLHPLAGEPLLLHILDLVEDLAGVTHRVLVLGHGHREVGKAVGERPWDRVRQKEQLGTGHAVSSAGRFLKGFKGDVLVLNGDAPLLRRPTVSGLIRKHRSAGTPMTLLTANLEDPAGYGRILRDERGRVQAVVEQKELKGGETRQKEVNVGVYVFDAAFLKKGLKGLARHPRTGEYYLTDLVRTAAEGGDPPAVLRLKDAEEALGVNRRRHLAMAEGVIRRRILESLMDKGVTVIDPANTYVQRGVKVGRDTVLMPGTILEKGTRIGTGCRIGPRVRISDSVIGSGAEIRDGSVVTGSAVGKGSAVGPMAHLRPGTRIGAGCKVGNFVEAKKSSLADGVSAGHLTYLGDARVGAGTNIGAGTVTCNYDGKSKHPTIIGGDVFVGSGVMLVAPVTIGEGAVIGAGSTITKDVPPGSLAVGRARQVNKAGRSKRGRKK